MSALSGRGCAEFSFEGVESTTTNTAGNDSAVFAQDDWKATAIITLNLWTAQRSSFGARIDGDCYIGNIESDPSRSPERIRFIYPRCVNKLGVPGLSGNAAGSDRQQ